MGAGAARPLQSLPYRLMFGALFVLSRVIVFRYISRIKLKHFDSAQIIYKVNTTGSSTYKQTRAFHVGRTLIYYNFAQVAYNL